MEPAADNGCDKNYLSKGGKRKETGNGVKEKEEGILRQLGEREKNLPR